MGSLKSKKKIHVSSTAYNLAGEEDKRNNFLKNAVLGTVLSNHDLYIGETLSKSYLRGPGIDFRRFAKWARESGFTENVVKQTHGTFTLPATLNRNAIAQAINPVDPNSVMLTMAEIGIAEYNYWAMKYMLENFPNDIEGSWASEMVDGTEQIRIVFYDSDPEEEETANIINEIFFTPVGYDNSARYIYAMYTEASNQSSGPIEIGDLISIGSQPFPSTQGYEFKSQEEISSTYTLTTTVNTRSTFSDDREPEEETTNTNTQQSVDETEEVWEKVTFQGDLEDQDAIGSLREVLNLFDSYRVVSDTTQTTSQEDIGEGVIKYTTVTTTVQSLVPDRAYRKDTQRVNMQGWSTAKMFIYQENTGNPLLDSQFMAAQSIGEFFPFIPVRMWNRFLSETYLPEMYTEGKEAVRRSIKGKFDEIVDSIADNKSVRDIDHAFIVFGVSLNVEDNSCKKYIFKFFQQIMAGIAGYDYEVWEGNFIDAQEKQAIWQQWRNAQNDSNDPLYGSPEPEYVAIPYSPALHIRLRSIHQSIDYDMTVSWSSINETRGTGLYKPDGKVGQVWIEEGIPSEDNLQLYVKNGEMMNTVVDWRDPIRMVWQTSADEYRMLLVRGLNYRNIVYDGKSVSISGRKALRDTDESGFIIPLHEQLFKEISLVDSTQMATASAFIVFNSYEVTKQKWYQRGAFKIIIVVAAIVITIMYPPGGIAAGGALGTNAAVGATLGFTGAVAVVVGAIANAIAAIVITQILTTAATKLLGAKWGSIVGTIAAIVTLSTMGSGMTGDGWAVNFSHLMRADNLLRLTFATGRGISAELQEKAQQYIHESEALIADYEKQSQRVAELYKKNIGAGTGIDPAAIAEIASKFEFNYEKPESFISRTLMTGTDIADLTHSLIEEFGIMTSTPILP